MKDADWNDQHGKPDEANRLREQAIDMMAEATEGEAQRVNKQLKSIGLDLGDPDLGDVFVMDPTDPAQRLHHQVRLRAELCPVLHVLESASPTPQVMRAGSLPPLQPGFDHLQEPPASPARRDSGNFDTRAVPRRSALDEHGPAIRKTPHPSPLGGQPLDRYVDHCAGGDGDSAQRPPSVGCGVWCSTWIRVFIRGK